jgi:hypothetical protein
MEILEGVSDALCFAFLLCGVRNQPVVMRPVTSRSAFDVVLTYPSFGPLHTRNGYTLRLYHNLIHSCEAELTARVRMSRRCCSCLNRDDFWICVRVRNTEHGTRNIGFRWCQ